MNIAFIFFFSYKTVKYDLSILLKKKPRIRVLNERHIWRWIKIKHWRIVFQIQKIDLMCMLCSQFGNIKVTHAWRIPQFLYDKKEQEAYGPQCSPVY